MVREEMVTQDLRPLGIGGPAILTDHYEWTIPYNDGSWWKENNMPV